jgi:hypothetical protein
MLAMKHCSTLVEGQQQVGIHRQPTSTPHTPVECTVLFLKRSSGRCEGLNGYPSGFMASWWSLMARGALGKVKPAKPPEAALFVQVF